MSILKLENVAYKYDGTKKYVLKDLNYEFEKGKIYSIVGPSGAGKTTLLSLLSGLSKPTGNLDSETQEEILKIFHTLADEGKCVILVTHSPDVANESDVVYELKKVSSSNNKETKK